MVVIVPQVTSLSALTLAVTDMAASTVFYEALGFERLYGGPSAGFTSYRAGGGYLNLSKENDPQGFWGRAIFYVDDVDAFHSNAISQGLSPLFEPRDASWRERYFHILDPDGHEISFAKPLETAPNGSINC